MTDDRGPQSAVGISNRETPREEAEERREHPPANPPDPDNPDQQQTSKSGVRSTAQKEAESKYTDRPMPATSKTDGASGREES